MGRRTVCAISNELGLVGERRDLGLFGRPTTIDAVTTFSVDFLGCKVSYGDAQAIGGRLLSGGMTQVKSAGDVAVLNTCCVTHEAVRKSRKAARRAARESKSVYVTGCAANLAGVFDDLPANVTVVVRPSEETPEFIARDLGGLACTQAHQRRDRVRAFVKIQDGCSFSCSFCVIPSVRGASRSRSAATVLAEIERRVAQGYAEIVLSGVNLGCFRDRGAGYDLARLVTEAGAIPGVRRLRLSSIEVNHLTEQLIGAMRESPVASPHLHVPLQSGDDGVLRAMGRKYSVAQYLGRVERAAGFNLTTDVIVGFPTEDEAAFARTLATVDEASITKVHVFPYSPRPGTPTAQRDPVPVAVKKERSARLRAASRRALRRRWLEKLGQDETVLVDRPNRGYGEDYTPWIVTAPVGEFVRVRGVAVADEGVVAALESASRLRTPRDRERRAERLRT